MSRRAARAWAQAIAVCSVALAGPFGSACGAQLVKTPQNTAAPTQSGGGDASTPDRQRELDIGADLTRRGSLQEAIPHLLAAQKAGADPYATAVNLGICYLGSGGK